MMPRALLALAVTAAAPAAAHDLRVFAHVEGGMVHVETAFSTGRVPQGGEIRVIDAAGDLIATHAIDPGGVTRFPLAPGHAATGLTIEVEATEGHADYWLLTPEDIARGTGGAG